jgi:hypothetical protein
MARQVSEAAQVDAFDAMARSAGEAEAAWETQLAAGNAVTVRPRPAPPPGGGGGSAALGAPRTHATYRERAGRPVQVAKRGGKVHASVAKSAAKARL